jgi:hypothetical protein
VAAYFFGACVFNPNDGEQKKAENPNVEGDLPEIAVKYSLEVMNNTDHIVKLYTPGGFYISETHSIEWALSRVSTVLFEIEGNKQGSCAFSWNPGSGSAFYGDDPSIPDPSIEEIQEWFSPNTASFYLKLELDGEEYYLAGWPQSLGFNTEQGVITIPGNKIVQYGLGYAENKEVRIKNGRAYIPFIVKDSKNPQGIDFDDVFEFVYAKAVLTINADKIEFETTELSPTPFEE